MSDSRDLAHHDGGGRSVAQRSESAGMIAVILEAARDPSVDAAKVETMANLAIKLQDRETEQQFNRDLNAALGEMPVITKAGIITIPANREKGTQERTQGRFARFEDIDRVVRPILQRHNLAIRFEVGENAQNITVCPILSHANGHTERGGAMRLPLDTSGAKNNVQGAGSAVSYGKRYTMCALLNIITEGSDDDGSLGKYAIGMPHERAVTILEQAEEAFAAGVYDAWYDKQGVKDRGWLVTDGHHARLGGSSAPAVTDGRPAPRSDPSASSPPSGAGSPPPKRTPDQMVSDYTLKLNDDDQIADREDYMALQDSAAKFIDGLQERHPALHQKIMDANAKRWAQLPPRGDA